MHMGTAQAWRTPLSEVCLLPNEVHLWRVDLDSRNPLGSSTEDCLSADEIARAKRFHFARDHARYAHTRIALRNILARYLTFPPRDIQFIYQENGKPELSPLQNQSGVQFNVSHSGSLAIISVSTGRRVGVDVEQYRTLEFLEIAHHYFSEHECRELSALAEDELQKNFFACWTRKEALLKALGEGIGMLSQVSVTVAHRERPKVLEFQNDPDELLRWSLIDIPVNAGYAAAFAFEHESVKVRRWVFR